VCPAFLESRLFWCAPHLFFMALEELVLAAFWMFDWCCCDRLTTLGCCRFPSANPSSDSPVWASPAFRVPFSCGPVNIDLHVLIRGFTRLRISSSLGSPSSYCYARTASRILLEITAALRFRWIGPLFFPSDVLASSSAP